MMGEKLLYVQMLEASRLLSFVQLS